MYNDCNPSPTPPPFAPLSPSQRYLHHHRLRQSISYNTYVPTQPVEASDKGLVQTIRAGSLGGLCVTRRVIGGGLVEGGLIDWGVEFRLW